YAEPALDARLRALAGAGVERLLVLPLYPQYSSTTTGTVAALVERERGPMQARVVEDYATDPGWVDAVAASIRAHWAAHGRGSGCCSRSMACRSGWSTAAIPTPRSARPAWPRSRARWGWIRPDTRCPTSRASAASAGWARRPTPPC